MEYSGYHKHFDANGHMGSSWPYVGGRTPLREILPDFVFND